MISKTPKFNKTIDAILNDLVPHERVCFECKQKFQVLAEDINFYKMFLVPPPTRCPKCRQIRRLSLLMRAPKFFKRPCTAPGHTEDVVTVFPPSSPHKIYDVGYWYSDLWDAGQYARKYDFNRKFFDQFKDLFFDVPHLSLERPLTAVNSEYSLGGTWSKNNYYSAGAYKSEDCLFTEEVRFSKSCVDCLSVWHSEFCYACVGSDHCSHCVFVIDSNQCVNSSFLYGCKNCIDCFLSSNLRNKSYVFENKQLTKKEYQEKVSELNLGDRKVFKEVLSRFDNIFKNALHRSLLMTNTVNCTGDSLTNCKDCFWSFDGTGGENFRFVESFDEAKDLMDVSYIPQGTERVYETVMGMGSNIFFSLYARTCMDIEYSSECNNCQNCFGCVGLKNKKFYIFNQPYSEEDYWKIVDEIKSKMLNDGEYGELFPMSLGLFPYQVNRSQNFYPLDEQKAKEKGIPWYPEPDSQVPEGVNLRESSRITNDIKNIDESILKDVIRCEITGRPFKITTEELKFYKHMNLPLPVKHPWQRMKERFIFRHPLELFEFICHSCGEKSLSIYNEEKQKQLKIFCEKCYLKEVI